MKKTDEKTNVMRLLDSKKVKYDKHLYVDTDAISGVEIAEVLHQDPNHVFKTLVTVGASGNHFVFLVPVHRELDLKKAARAAGEKNIVMIKQKELLPLTGYIHGGCSPIGMKKQFPTFIDATAENFDTILFSAGRIGYQVEITLDELRKALKFELVDLTV
jgi:Cys-tRNA(Pro)/Cys-tRNA(Cys) deacylase